MKLYKKYLNEQLKVDITSDEEYAQAVKDIMGDLKGLVRKSSSDRKRMLRDIQETIKDLLKYRG